MTGYLMVILSMIVWGSIGIFVRYIDQPPEVIVFFRVFIAFSTLLLISLFTGKNKDSEKVSKGEWGILLLSGLFISLNWLFFFKAVKTTTIVAATMSYYTAPIIVTILSLILLGDKLSLRTAISVILSFSGVALMTMTSGNRPDNFSIEGVFYGLVAAFFYALVTVSVKKLKNIPSNKISLFQMGIASVIFLPVTRQMNKFDNLSMILMVIVGIVHTCIALYLYFEGIKRVKVQYVGILSYLDPLVAVVLAAVFFSEIPNLATIAGGSLILVSTYMILNRNSENKKLISNKKISRN